MMSLYPSGSAFAAACVPIIAPAPGRVSTITGWRQCSVNFCPITRARMSTDPPGANGTMILIGFSGYVSAGACAGAPLAPRMAAAMATASARATRAHRATGRPLTFLCSFLSCAWPFPSIPASVHGTQRSSRHDRFELGHDFPALIDVSGRRLRPRSSRDQSSDTAVEDGGSEHESNVVSAPAVGEAIDAGVEEEASNQGKQRDEAVEEAQEEAGRFMHVRNGLRGARRQRQNHRQEKTDCQPAPPHLP